MEPASSAPSPPKKSTKRFTDISQKTSAWCQKKINVFIRDPHSWVLLLILFGAFLIRLKYIGQESLWNDEAVHLWRAILITREPLTLFTREYLLGDYALPQTLYALFYLVLGNVIIAAKSVAMLYGLAGVFGIYLLGKEFRSKTSGLIAAALLAFNHLFWFYGVRTLADSPLLVTLIFLLYAMARLEKTKDIRWGIATGCLFLVAMLTKVQSSIFIFPLLLYYLLFHRQEMIREKAFLYSWLIPLGLIALAQAVGTFVFKTGIMDRVFQLFLDQRGMPFGFEAAKALLWIFDWYLVALMLLGLLLVLIYRQRQYYFSLLFFLFYWLFFEINVDNTQDRYVLPLLSIAVIFAAFSLEEIAHYVSAFTHRHVRWIVIIVPVVFMCWSFYQIGDPLIYGKALSYTGYAEAGQWIKENVPADAPLFAGEYRLIRLHSEREFGGPPGPPSEDYGGTIWNLRSPYRYAENRSAFEEDIARLAKEGDVYLEIDNWEYEQPKWYYPLTQQSIDYFLSQGFQLIKVVEAPVLTKDGPKDLPMIFIFRKAKSA